jgi:2-C-methyl-D-erythritol 4-phosphate cytidylyltransferase
VDLPDEHTAFGSVLVPAGSLPFALLHGEALVACAAWGLGEAGVNLLDDSVDWPGLLTQDEDEESLFLVLHDALCPALPPSFIASCLATSVDTGVVVAGALPVTDTVKELHQDGAGWFVGATLDRDGLAQVTSPVVLPPAAVRIAAELWPGGPGGLPVDPAEIVSRLAERIGVHLAAAPPEGRRVESLDEVRLLEAGTTPHR